MIEKRYADHFTQGSQVGWEIAEREIVLTYVLRILDDAGREPIAWPTARERTLFGRLGPKRRLEEIC